MPEVIGFARNNSAKNEIEDYRACYFCSGEDNDDHPGLAGQLPRIFETNGSAGDERMDVHCTGFGIKR